MLLPLDSAMSDVNQCAIIIDRNVEWIAAEWVGRNLAAHLYTTLALATTRVEDRLAGLLSGTATIADLSMASVVEMRELLRASESAQRSIKQPSQWADPASAPEFLEAFDRFVHMLHADRRVANIANTN